MAYFTSNHFGSSAFNSNYFGGQNAASAPGSTGAIQSPQKNKARRWRAPREINGRLSVSLDGATFAAVAKYSPPSTTGQLSAVLDGAEFHAFGAVKLPPASAIIHCAVGDISLSVMGKTTTPPPAWGDVEDHDAIALLLLA
jgi:hypothetical protein